MREEELCFSYRKEGSAAVNRGVWEVAFADGGGVRTAAFFDHLIIDEERFTDLEEAEAFRETGREGVETLLREIVASLIPDFGRTVILTLTAAEWPLKKPDGVSPLRWFFSRPRTKIKFVLERQYREAGIAHRFVGRYFVWLSFRKNENLLKSYFWRLGRMPGDVPDVLFLPLDSGEPDFGEYEKHRALIERLHNPRRGEIDAGELKQMLEKMLGVIYALDGHIYYTTARESLDDLKRRADSLAARHNLKVAADLIPAALQDR